MQIQFLGAARQVTGSRSVLEAGGLRIMIDCGLFQEREFVERNWEMPIVEPGAIDCLVVTHAHLDHVGLIPRLVAQGFDGPIHTTAPTCDLAAIIMKDSARIQAEDVRYKKKRHRRARHSPKHPVKPLYTEDDADAAVKRFIGHSFGTPVALNENVDVTFYESGHILGSASVVFDVREDGETRRVVFSGDVGQWDKPLIGDPTLLPTADYIVLESTYGNRNHRESGPLDEQLETIINQTAARGGNVVIPTFALERAQELMFWISRLVRADRIPDLPIFLDSPMAIDITDLFRKHRAWLDAETTALIESGEPPLHFPGLKMCRSVDDSKRIAHTRGPCVIMATSGMCNAGRIKHHLRANIERPESTVVFVGYQAHGTLGNLIQQRKKTVRIHGQMYDVKAQVHTISGFSAHGDQEDLLRWLGALDTDAPQHFLNHGEERAMTKLAERIRDRLDSHVFLPAYTYVAEL